MSTKPTAGGLKLVFAVRHGKYEYEGLSKIGRHQVANLAEHLRKIIPSGYRVAILTSKTLRAEQSAEILAATFGVTYRFCSILRNDEHSYGREMMLEVKKMVDDAHVVVAITHSSSPSGIANAFAVEYFGGSVEPDICDNANGYAVLLEKKVVIDGIFSIDSID